MDCHVANATRSDGSCVAKAPRRDGSCVAKAPRSDASCVAKAPRSDRCRVHCGAVDEYIVIARPKAVAIHVNPRLLAMKGSDLIQAWTATSLTLLAVTGVAWLTLLAVTGVAFIAGPWMNTSSLRTWTLPV